jgi:Pyridoxamine 5'-phosphate oxidase
MPEREPVEVTNLDRYGYPELAWSRARDRLATPPTVDVPFFLGTSRPDGRPHSAGIGALWYDGDVYIVSGPGTRKSRNLAENPACTISMSLEGIDLVLEGEATRVTDRQTLEVVAGLYRAQGWPAEVEGEAFTAPYSAPSAGPPPWDLYRFTFHTVFGIATAEPYGATRWRF